MTHEQYEQRQQQLEYWFHHNYQDISDQLFNSVSADCADSALVLLANEIKKCPAHSEYQFRTWTSRWIEKYAEDIRLGPDMDLHKVLSMRKLKRKNAAPFPEYEQHGDKVYVQLTAPDGQNRTWIIPSEWLCVAQRLWPFHLRRYAGGSFYVAKKVSVEKPNGTLGRVVVPLHRLFVETGGYSLVGDRRAKMVTAKDGDYLHWTDGNLTTTQRTSSDVMDVRPHGKSVVFSLGTDAANVLTLDNDVLSAGSLPAKPTRPPGHGPHESPEREEWTRSALYEAMDNALTGDAPESDLEPSVIDADLPILSEAFPSPLTKALCRTHGVQKVTNVSNHPDGLVVALECGCRRSEAT